MSNVALFDKKLPAHLSKYAGLFGGNSALLTRSGPSYDVLTIKGKVWRVVEAATKERITLKDEDGEVLPAVRVHIVSANPQVSKVFYKTGYEEGSDAPPDCSSNGGIRPDAGVKEPQSKTCSACPHNVWGSGKDGKGRACSDSRRIAVAPEGDASKVMLLRVPAASLKNLNDFGNQAEKRGVPYQALITRISFDPDASSPKLVFKPVDFASEEAIETIKSLQDDEVVKAITGIDDSAPAEDEAAAPEVADKPADKPAATKAKAKAAPAPAPAEEEEDEEEAAPAPAPKAKAKAAAAELPDDVASMLDGLDLDD